MRPSPPHRRELARRNENTVTRASSTAPRTSRGAPPHRLKTQLAAKRHSCRRRDAKRYAVPSRSNPRLRRHSLLGHRHLQLGQPGLRRGALRSGNGTAGQSAVGVGRAERRTRVERTRSDDLPMVGASVGSGRGGGAAVGIRAGQRAHLVGEYLVAAPDLLLELVHGDAAGAREAESEGRDPGAQHPRSDPLFSSRSPRTRARSPLPSNASPGSSTRGSGA